MKISKRLLLAISLFAILAGLPLGGQEGGESAGSTDPAAGSGQAAVVELEGEINPFRVVFLRRAIEKAQEAEVDTIIFALNTFGGRVDSALQMATLIGALDDIRTIAYIPAKEESTGVSWSAGALISFSCNAIYMAPGTSIGAAAPVFQSSEGTEAAGEKTVSAVRTQMAALAEKNGYPPEVAVAMVDKDAELRMVTGDDGNQSFYLAGRSAAREGGEETAGEQDYTVISPEGKLLALTAGEMERYGISSGTTSTVAALTDALELAVISEIAPDRADRTVSFLTSAGFTSILLTIGLLALYMEISSPGFGVPGTVAITAFAVIFVSSGLLGTLGSLELLLFLLGVVLLAAEVFLIPGFGVAGILGLLSMSMGLLLSRQEFFLPETEWQWDLFLTNITVVFGTLAASFLIMGVLMIFFPRIRLFQRLILSSSEAGYYGGAAAPAAGGGQRSIGSAGGTLPENTAPSSGSPSSVSSGAASSGAAARTSAAEPAGREQGHGQDRGQEPEAAAGEKSLLGAKGTALTDLRPTGRAEIDGEYYPVVSEGRWIERGAPLRVVEVEGNRIVVEEGEG